MHVYMIFFLFDWQNLDFDPNKKLINCFKLGLQNAVHRENQEVLVVWLWHPNKYVRKILSLHVCRKQLKKKIEIYAIFNLLNVYSIKISMWITYQFQPYNCTHISTCIFLLANITYSSSERMIFYKCHNSLVNFKWSVNFFLRRLSFTFSFKKGWHNCIHKFWFKVSLSVFISFRQFRVRNFSRC